MTPKLLRLPDVTAAVGLGVTKIYDDVGKGLLPAPIKRDRSSFWPADEIGAVVAARIAGKSDAEIKALVEDLVAARGAALPQFLAQHGITVGQAVTQ
jgi:prophage regulatory protein